MRCQTTAAAALAALLCIVGPSSIADTLSYTEPFGVAHKRVILSLALAKPVDPAATRLVDASGKDVPYRVAVDGKSILLRTDIGPRETHTWKLAAGTPAAADTSVKRPSPSLR